MYKTVHAFALNNFNLIKRLPVSYSTVPAVKEKNDYSEQLKEFQKMSNISQKVRTKNPQKPPFAKNLLIGVVDTDILTYPQLQKEDWLNLEKELKPFLAFVRQPEMQECETPTKQIMEKLGRNKGLGLQASQLMDGRELNVTESCRFMEAISETTVKNAVINSEQLGANILLKYGSDTLKRKYLEKYMSGKELSAFCMVQPLSSNFDVLKRTAVLSSDKKSWILDGKTKFIINGSTADFFIVIAHTDSVLKDSMKQLKLTAFVVDRDFGGITTKRHDMVDSNLEVSDIVFENTHIPADNVIGKVGSAQDMLTSIYPENRLSQGPVCTTLNKKLINELVAHCIEISKEPYFLYETDAIREKVSKMTVSLYAIESMIYLTTGLMDNYENQDCELESTIVKVFASEETFKNTASCLKLIGPDANTEGHWCNQLHKEAMCLVNLPDSNDNLKILIAMFGLRHAGQHLNDVVKKMRNPLFHAGFIVKRMWTHRRQEDDNPKLDLFLHHYLHPSFLIVANHLEYCVLRLKFATEIMLSRYGQDVVNRHMEMERLAECIIDIYAMIACISRASRSYCIGLQHSEFEMTITTAFCLNARKRVQAHVKEIVGGHFHTNDENHRVIAKRVFKFKEYFPVHPLTRNF